VSIINRQDGPEELKQSENVETNIEDPDRDSDGDYRDHIWQLDLGKRRFKKEEDDSEVDFQELKESNANEEFYNELNTGDYFGELGLTEGKEKSMSVYCVRNCHLFYIEKETFDSVVTKFKNRIEEESV
jgi:hypothetical protein